MLDLFKSAEFSLEHDGDFFPDDDGHHGLATWCRRCRDNYIADGSCPSICGYCTPARG